MENLMSWNLDLEKIWMEKLNFLNEISIPESDTFDIFEWADRHVPNAREYIESIYKHVIKAIAMNDRDGFNYYVERYEKAWIRLYQLIAKEYFERTDINDVDMRYYRHMPDGYSMVWDSKKLGFKFKVFPRKPKKPPTDMKWITAGELIRLHENPAIFKTMEILEGWFDRSDGFTSDAIEQAMKEDKKLEPKLKYHRKDKYGYEWFK